MRSVWIGTWAQHFERAWQGFFTKTRTRGNLYETCPAKIYKNIWKRSMQLCLWLILRVQAKQNLNMQYNCEMFVPLWFCMPTNSKHTSSYDSAFPFPSSMKNVQMKETATGRVTLLSSHLFSGNLLICFSASVHTTTSNTSSLSAKSCTVEAMAGAFWCIHPRYRRIPTPLNAYPKNAHRSDVQKLQPNVVGSHWSLKIRIALERKMCRCATSRNSVMVGRWL